MVEAGLFHFPKTKLFVGGQKCILANAFPYFLRVFFKRMHQDLWETEIRSTRDVEVKKQEIQVLTLQPNNQMSLGNQINSSDLSFVIYKMGIIIIIEFLPASQGCCEEQKMLV